MIQKLTNKLRDRKRDNKGFTLVELIVVIVILAILAAILVPGLIKWIDQAKNKQYELEARSIYMATQAVITKEYTGTVTAGEVILANSGDTAAKITKINELSGLTVTNVKYTMNDKGTITAFETTFTSSSGGSAITMKWETNKQWEKITTP